MINNPDARDRLARDRALAAQQPPPDLEPCPECGQIGTHAPACQDSIDTVDMYEGERRHAD